MRVVGLEDCLLVNHLPEPFLEHPTDRARSEDAISGSVDQWVLSSNRIQLLGREEFALIWLTIESQHVDRFHRDLRKLKELLEYLLALQLDGMCHGKIDLLHCVRVICVYTREDLLRQSRLVPHLTGARGRQASVRGL